MAPAGVGSAGRGSRVILVLEDRLLRESLAMALVQDGFRILEFADAEAALTEIEAGTDIDALVVDAGAHSGIFGGSDKGGDDGRTARPESGEEPRARLRAARCASPVYLLTAHGESHAAAERWGAVGVIDRSQSTASVKRTLMNAIRAGALLAEPGAFAPGRQGPLVFSAEGTRVSWKGCYLDLGASERALLSGLVAAPDNGLTVQRAQAILNAADEPGTAGGPERVKSLIRRLRKKFREVDPEFDQIVFVPGCGYGWRGSAVLAGEPVR
jgi:two-component system, OmpR family, response regulator ChvI